MDRTCDTCGLRGASILTQTYVTYTSLDLVELLPGYFSPQPRVLHTAAGKRQGQ